MLVVTTNQNDFEHDIHALVKAFYPAAEVKVFLGGDADSETVSSSAGLPDININFIEGRILLMIYANEEEEEGEDEGGELSETERTRLAIIASNKASSSFRAAGIDINEDMGRLEVKNALKQLIYGVLSDHTGTLLPWGALTGIRPARIAFNLLEQGLNDEEIAADMEEIFFCSRGKAELALAIAKKEREILADIDGKDSYSLYIAVPFCPTTCLYCSFTSYPLDKYGSYVNDYLQALFQEIDFIADCYRGKKLTAIYIGGGTPTTLTEGQLDSLLAKIGASLDLSQLREYTVEAGRPDSITRAKLAVLQKHYVNRISINPQSMNDKTLELIGRKHTAKEVREAFQLAREMGFANINMDIILGLPGETPADLAATMAELAKLNPDSLTVHALAVKRGAKLTDWVNENGLADIVVTEETVQIAADGARDMGMQPYYVYRQKNTAGNFENVGYAKEGHYGLYNVLMMEEVHDVAAIGAGAITKRVFADGQAKRCDSVKELEQYIERIAEMIGRKRELLQVSNT